jgi:hypothetical protein
LALKRVGAVRALLAIHGQMGWNRTLRGLGRYGALSLVIIVLVLAAMGSGMGYVFAILGMKLGRHIDLPEAPLYLGIFVTIVTLAFGFMGGVLGGTRQLTWEAYKSYPVRFRTLFIAELGASAGDVLVLAYLILIASLGIAFAIQKPWLIVPLALFLGQATLWMLFMQQIIGAMAIAVVKRLRVAFLVVMVAAWIGLSFVGRAAETLEGQIRADRLDQLLATWHLMRPWLEQMPTVDSAAALAFADAGDWRQAAILELPMLGVTLALGAVTYLLLRREASPRSQSIEGAAVAAAARWSAAGPVLSIARLHAHHLMSSLQGRFGLVVPIITVVLVKGPLANATAGSLWVIPGAVTYLAVTAGQLQFNQFGFDGPGVKTLLLLPITMRQILLGKALAMVAYCSLQYAFLFALLGWMLQPSAREIVGGVLLAGCLLVAHVAEGHWVSAAFPRPIPFHRMQGGGLQGAHLFPLGLGAVNATAFGGAYGALLSWAPLALVPAMVGALAAVLLAYRALLPMAARYVTERRERLVEVLG